jgi:hypothetical protein
MDDFEFFNLNPTPTQIRGYMTGVRNKAREEAEHEAFESRQILWNRLKEYNDEWRAENPKERALTNEDSLSLIKWKIARVSSDARREALEEERARVASICEVYRQTWGTGYKPFKDLIDSLISIK